MKSHEPAPGPNLNAAAPPRFFVCWQAAPEARATSKYLSHRERQESDFQRFPQPGN